MKSSSNSSKLDSNASSNGNLKENINGHPITTSTTATATIHQNHQSQLQHHSQVYGGALSNQPGNFRTPLGDHIGAQMGGTQPLVPPGVVAIYHACSTIYKNQPNPLQVTAVRKYW